MGVHRNVNKRKKDHTKIRRERKDAKRVEVASKILKKEGKDVTAHAVRSTVKNFQQKGHVLQNRISKKKERKILKSFKREQEASRQMEVETLPLNPSDNLPKKKQRKRISAKAAHVDDVEMLAATGVPV